MARQPIDFLEYLPELFRTDDMHGFLARFLKPFEVSFEELQHALDAVPSLFHPDSTPPEAFKHKPPDDDFEFLHYLASWLGLPVRAEIVRRVDESDQDYAKRKTSWN
ncbi:MAG: hypothetical protein AAB403_02490, partial [Planctomycetota bacterium]